MATLANLDARHRQRTLLHRRVLDFSAAEKAQSLAISFTFDGPLRVVTQGRDSAEYGGIDEVRNLAQAMWTAGWQTHRFGNLITANGFVFNRLDLTEPSEADGSNLEFDLLPDSLRLFLSTGRHNQRVDNATLQLYTTVVPQAARQGQSAESITLMHRPPVRAASLSSTHVATQGTFGHFSSLDPTTASHELTSSRTALHAWSPLKLRAPAHGHTAQGATLTHRSPLVAHAPRHRQSAVRVVVTHRSSVVPGARRHGHGAQSTAITQRSPLAVARAGHRQWVTRISYLPEDWQFFASVTVEAESRGVVVPTHGR